MWPTVFFPHFIVGRCRSAGTARWLPSWCCFCLRRLSKFSFQNMKHLCISVYCENKTEHAWNLRDQLSLWRTPWWLPLCEWMFELLLLFLFVLFHFSMRTLNNSHFTQRAVPDLRPLCNPAKHTIDLNNGSRYSPSLGFHTLLWFIFHVEHPHMGHRSSSPVAELCSRSCDWISNRSRSVTKG